MKNKRGIENWNQMSGFNRKLRLWSLLALMVIIFASASYAAVDDLLELQGVVTDAGGPVASANLHIEIWDSAVGGSKIWDSGVDHNGAIFQGDFDIVMGLNASNPLTLDYGTIYYLDMAVAGEDMNFGANARQPFMSSVGNVTASQIEEEWVDEAGDTMTGNLVVNSNIGINYSNPGVPLEIGNNTDGARGDIRVNVGDVGASPGTRGLTIARRSGLAGYQSNIYHVGTTPSLVIENRIDASDSYGSIKNRIGNTDSSSSVFTVENHAGTALMTVRGGTGNVGIGTANPNSKLDVYGDITLSQGTLASIKTNTTDGADNSGIALVGGGANGQSRGASVIAAGNERSGSGGMLYLRAGEAGDISLMTGAGGNTRMLIDSNGNVGIGTTNPGYLLDIAGSNGQGIRLNNSLGTTSAWLYITNTDQAYFKIQDATTTSDYVQITPGNTVFSGSGTFTVDTLGLGYACTSAGGTFSTGGVGGCGTSSIIYKKDVTDLEVDSSRIYDLEPVSFTWKQNDERDFGLIAEDVEQIIPELVTYEPNGTIRGVKYNTMSVILLEEMKKLKSENEALKELVCQDHPEAAVCN